jgi:hypothetical protein
MLRFDDYYCFNYDNEFVNDIFWAKSFIKEVKLH